MKPPKRIRVKPALPGLRVPLPMKPGQYLAQDGEELNASSYWTRRILSGDVLLVEAAPVRPAPKKSARKPKPEEPDQD